jgi:hypothetical protein
VCQYSLGSTKHQNNNRESNLCRAQVSWLVLEIGHTLFLIFELPHLGLQTVFVLLAIGFPVATAAAWRYQFGTAKQDHEAAHTDGHGSQRPSSSASSRCWSSAPS